VRHAPVGNMPAHPRPYGCADRRFPGEGLTPHSRFRFRSSPVKTLPLLTLAGISLAFALPAPAAVSPTDLGIARLSAFGGGDGWLAPGEGGYTHLGTGTTERGLAYGNGELYLVSRAGDTSVRRLNALTGADLGGLNMTGISGGTYAANMVGVAADGAIYVGNLKTATDTNFKVYRWANDAATPTVAYDAAPGVARVGDSFAVLGSGTGTRIVASGSGTSGFVAVDPTAGTGTHVTVAGTASGDFRLGMTYVDANTVIGAQGGSSPFRWVDYDGATGTLVASPTKATTGERILSYTLLDNVPLLATLNTTTAAIRIYDASNPAKLNLLATVNNTSGTLAENGTGVGSLAWAPLSKDTALLYALSANQGIQAFSVTIPEPGVPALLGLGAALLVVRRGRRW